MVNGMLDRIAQSVRADEFETGALAGDRGKLDEFDLIAFVFAPLTGGDQRALGLLDDAACCPGRRTRYRHHHRYHGRHPFLMPSRRRHCPSIA